MQYSLIPHLIIYIILTLIFHHLKSATQHQSHSLSMDMKEAPLPTHHTITTAQTKTSQLPDHEQPLSKYIWFRVGKNLDIEPETTTMDKQQNHHHESECQRCVCGCGGYEKEDSDVDDEFLSAYDVQNWVDSSESGNSSASSFAFPVLDARWSGSPVQMPHHNFNQHKKLSLLRKPKMAARFICRWCRSF